MAALVILAAAATSTSASASASASAPVAPLDGQPNAVAPLEGPPNAGDPFAKGSWVFQTYGSAALGDEAGRLYTTHLGLGYHPIDGLSINAEALLAHVELNRGGSETAQLAGMNLLARWHFIRQDGFTVYFDAGAGCAQTTEPFPHGGTHFNFTPQAGFGATIELTRDAHWLIGARWLHLSNNDKNGPDNNPGFDAALFYTGLMISF